MKNISFLLLMLLALGCSEQSDLSDSVYVPDPIDPALPAYSEWGYNTFGANYERSIFVYDRDQIPLKIIKDGRILSLIMQGVAGGSYLYNQLTMIISWQDTTVTSYQDLLTYHDSRIDLSDPEAQVELLSIDGSEILNIIDGEFYIKRAQTVYVDDEESQIIISGYFNLGFIRDIIPAGFTDGRFDFGVNEDNFYLLN